MVSFLPIIKLTKTSQYLSIICIVLLVNITAKAQSIEGSKKDQYTDINFGFGEAQSTIGAGYFYNWHLGKKSKFFIGTGARLTAYYGTNINFLSAPSSLANDIAKTDTLFVANPGIYAVNTIINLGYNFSSKFQVGFNIDFFGFSFGPQVNPVFKGNGSQTIVKANPTTFNLLLIGNNDKGTLNSEFYLRYKLSKKVGLKLGYQHLFTELTTTTKVQTVPELNDRFRNKANLMNVGISYHF